MHRTRPSPWPRTALAGAGQPIVPYREGPVPRAASSARPPPLADQQPAAPWHPPVRSLHMTKRGRLRPPSSCGAELESRPVHFFFAAVTTFAAAALSFLVCTLAFAVSFCF